MGPINQKHKWQCFVVVTVLVMIEYYGWRRAGFEPTLDGLLQTKIGMMLSRHYMLAQPSNNPIILCLCFVLGTWWRHQMVTGEFPTQWPVRRSFDVVFDLCLNKRLSKQSWGRWFETPSCSLWGYYICHALHVLQQCRARSQYKDRLIYVWRFPC